MRPQFQSTHDGWYVPDFSSGSLPPTPRTVVVAVASSSRQRYRMHMLVSIMALVVVMTLIMGPPFQLTTTTTTKTSSDETPNAASPPQTISIYETRNTGSMNANSMYLPTTTYYTSTQPRVGNGRTEPSELRPAMQEIPPPPKVTQEITTKVPQQNELEPSHVQICRLVLSPQSAPILVTEQESVCLDEHGAGDALSQIFLSAYLSISAQSSGLVMVDYRHNCEMYRNEPSFVTELLPSLLVTPEHLRLLQRDDVLSLCRGIVENTDDDRGSSPSALEIVLDQTLPRRNEEDAPHTAAGRRKLAVEPSASAWSSSHMMMMRPLIQTNLRSALKGAYETDGVLQFRYGVLNPQHARNGRLAVDTAVVYLSSCLDRACQDVAVLPYMEYLLKLPLSVRIVDVVISPRCLETVSLCRRYAEDLASTIRQFLPAGVVTVELVASSPASLDSFGRLLTAEYVVCGPIMNTDCTFAAIMDDQQAKGRFIQVGSPSSDKESRLESTSNAQMAHGTTERLLSMFKDGQQLSEYVQLSPDPSTGDCRFVRGRVGQWIKDLDYAKHAQYRTPLRHYSGNPEKLFRKKVARGETGGLQYRPSTTYRWQETRYTTCDATLISFEGVCALLGSMNARRIFVLGDSLSLQLAQSLWMWLSSEGESPLPKGTLEPNFRHTFHCPTSQASNATSFEFVLQFVRNDKLQENNQPLSIDKEVGNCGTKTYCYPWTVDFKADPRRTILLANIGAHVHSFAEFRSGVDGFVDIIDQLDRPDDVVLFRTVVPGHWRCDRPGLVPFHSFAEYLQDADENRLKQQDEVYSWGQFSLYNGYAARKIHLRQHARVSNGAPIELLDVFPTTVLRPDGHCSDEFRPDNYLSTDCLHYTLPGPIDWWSHLAFSHLLDIAKAETLGFSSSIIIP